MDKKNILIVDDDPRLRKTLSDVFKAKGYTPITAATGKEALDKVREEGPALALIDLKLEDMSGLEVLRGIKECSPGTECIVITGHASQESAIEAVNLGAYSYVRKPSDMEQLLLTMQRAIEKREAEEELRESEERYRTLVDNSRDAILMLDNERKIVSCNQAFLDLFGYKKNEVEEESIRIIHQSDDSFHSFGKTVYPVIEKSGSVMLEWEFIRKDGTIISVETVVSAIKSSDGSITGYVSVPRNITHRKKEEEEKKKLESQLIQSQKMEAIGRLAGGIAHDFNNLLTTIIGYTELMLMQVDKDSPLRTGMEEIKKASDRAANLTSQLLAFSRKQMIQPVVLNINYPLAEMDKMLRRLIGEDIDLVTILEPELWKVKFDPGQVDQMVINLAVNAKDAMPEGGKLTIETANLDLDEAYARQHGVELKPGPFVMVAVSDTGMGLDEEIQSHIFEPFFTTKETGKGTGLGLSTVYGIVELNRSAVVFLLP